MRARLVVTLFLCSAALVAPSAQGPQPASQAGASQAKNAPRARVVKVRPRPQTEVALDEAFLASDGAGRKRLILSGPLTNGQRERLFWVVDPKTNQYHVLRLTDNHASDAKRIQKLYSEFGFKTSEEDIASHLFQDWASQEQKIRALKDRASQGNLQARLGKPDNCVGGPSDDEGEGQYSVTCQGYGYADVQTWEPARYLFPVDHLNETWAAAWWTHTEPSGSFGVTPAGFCWANPQTFANTHWYQTYCSDTALNGLYHGFDLSKTGQYVNFDFLYQVFNIPYPSPITVSSTASVQFANGQAIWGGQYYEDGQDGYVTAFQSFLITGQIWGEAYEYGCAAFCDPDPWVLLSCQLREPAGVWYWDYSVCDCLGGASPILIDLDNDGLNLTNPANGVVFDLLANGHPVKVAWTRADAHDAFLALDRNHNGVIDNGGELFGNVTAQPLLQGKPPKKQAEPNGFLALSIFDDPANGGNGDGQITDEDAVYNDLRLWVDANHDGISQPAEMKPLADYGVRAISLHYTVGKKVDEFGNVYRFRSHVTMDSDLQHDGAVKRRAVDVFFKFVSTP